MGRGEISGFFHAFTSTGFGTFLFWEYSLRQEVTAMPSFFYHFAIFDALIIGAILLLIAVSMFGQHEA